MERVPQTVPTAIPGVNIEPLQAIHAIDRWVETTPAHVRRKQVNDFAAAGLAICLVAFLASAE